MNATAEMCIFVPNSAKICPVCFRKVSVLRYLIRIVSLWIFCFNPQQLWGELETCDPAAIQKSKSEVSAAEVNLNSNSENIGRRVDEKVIPTQY